MKTLKKKDLVFTILTQYCHEHEDMLYWHRLWKSPIHASSILDYESIYREHSERYFVLQEILIAYGYTLSELLHIENYDGSLYDYVK